MNIIQKKISFGLVVGTRGFFNPKLAQIQDYGTIPDYIKEENILKQARLSVVIDGWMIENELDASAVQCWTSVQNNYGCATCLSMSMMGEKYEVGSLLSRIIWRML